MQSIWTRVAVLAALAAAVALFVVLSDDDSDSEDGTTATERTTAATTDTAAEPAATVIQVKGGQPVGGVQGIAVTRGERVDLDVRFDQAEAGHDEVHVHGYDITRPVRANRARVSFVADLEGIFEVETHQETGEAQIAELRVNP